MKVVFSTVVVSALAAVPPMPDCSSSEFDGCATECKCVETQCASLYDECLADTQCDGIATCLQSCTCSNLLCDLGCALGKTLNNISSSVKTCGMGCKSDGLEWKLFKAQHKKVYLDDADEKQRYELYLASKERVAKLNELNGQQAFGINWMSDRLPEEQFKTGHKKPAGFKPSAPVRTYARRNAASIDWHLTEAITAIKNQGQCGSCWAFSATEAVESQLVLTSGGSFAIELSPQQITSCTPSTGTYGCDGCNGGFTEGAYEYLQTVTGLANSFFYPYSQSLTASSTTAACDTAKVSAIDGTDEVLQGGYAAVTGYSYATTPCTSGACTSQNLDEFAAALENTPVSVCVNAGAWNDYTGGVMTSAACGSMAADEQDHCVMATGFNSTAPTPYWIVRNSWSSTWGEHGYIYLEMAENTCGLADDATIPEVALDMSLPEKERAAAGRESLFQRASQGSARAFV